MASFLYVPAPTYITENPELAAKRNTALTAWTSSLLPLLGNPAETGKSERGAFRGARTFTYSGSDSAVLAVYALTMPGKIQSTEFIRVAALIRQKDCVLLGSTWQVEMPLSSTDIPSFLKQTSPTLQSVKSRTPRLSSSFQFKGVAEGSFASRSQVLFDLIGGERMAAKGYAVDSATSRMSCAAAGPVSNAYPAKPHRLVIGRFQFLNPIAGAWPQALSRVEWNAGVFGEKKQPLFESKTPVLWDPDVLLSASAFKVLEESAHDMNRPLFKVIKREGRWVFLDRGRAFGLEIGMHLQSNGGATMHVIHFAPAELQADVAVALVREEKLENKVKVGDEITFDNTIFPPQTQK